MNRAVEIINSLRTGMSAILNSHNHQKVNSLRMFNFEKNRVSLRMELIDKENKSHPIGIIDVVEYPTGKGDKASCNCFMTELETGKSEKLILKLNHPNDQKTECDKVFNFFKKVLKIPEAEKTCTSEQSTDTSVDKLNETLGSASDLYPPSDGKIPDAPRGAQ